MDFLHTQLDIPAPKVVGWASPVDDENPVGAEYIIIEKAQGESLGSRFLSLSKGEFAAIIRQIVDFEFGSSQPALLSTEACTTRRIWKKSFVKITQTWQTMGTCVATRPF